MIIKRPTPPTRLLLALIRAYQKTLSPDTGIFSPLFPYGFCRFYPTCSSYAYRAIRKYGLGRGLRRSLARVARCNPMNAGGFDPLL